jgi:hypothetical protein
VCNCELWCWEIQRSHFIFLIALKDWMCWELTLFCYELFLLFSSILTLKAQW